MSNLKLFVWEDVLRDYSTGVMFALAKDESEARKLLLEQCPHLPDEDINEQPKVVEEPYSFILWGGG